MRYVYDRLIAQNIAPKGVTNIVVQRGDTTVCRFGAGNLVQSVGEPDYSVGVLSDTHTIAKETAEGIDSRTDLARAIKYFSGVAEITCVCGDLASYYDEGLTTHVEIVNANRGSMQVWEIAGNHEHYNRQGSVSIMDSATFETYTGKPLRYVETRRSDVYIMCGASGWYDVFNQDSDIQWLYEQLETYRNQRCFLFVHSFLEGLEGLEYCGDYKGLCSWQMFGTKPKYRAPFIRLLQHYKNTIYIHGHSHKMLQMQEYLEGLTPPSPANYDHALGIHSIHVPSLAYPRDITSGVKQDSNNKYELSQGYLIDVYPDHIVLNGLEFSSGSPEPIGIATYRLDTPLHTVEAGTFNDQSGIIQT